MGVKGHIMFEQLTTWLSHYWVTITVILHICLSVATSLHVLLFKENERTSLAWIGLVVFSPFLGSLFYWMFGINRIKRTARKQHPSDAKQTVSNDFTPVILQQVPPNWHSAIISGRNINSMHYEAGNQVDLLINGDAAYPVMLASINKASKHIILASYIFDYDTLGQEFVSALARAHKRGVIVNVLLDAVGIKYSWHKSDSALNKLGVTTARFLPTFSFTTIRFINLRNHRKIMCVDGKEAFMGGMNISKSNLVETAKHPVDDVHFKLSGPVIDQISQVFIEDWFFATGELIEFPQFELLTARPNSYANVLARVVQDGPDEHHNRVHWSLINALVCAQKSVKIMTPYFIPDRVLMSSLHAAALRGVLVEVVVPARNNVPFIDWVMQANAGRIIKHGIKLYKNTRPFDHTKIMLIDDVYSFIGSSNWDARSFEFNFEINLECFDTRLNTQLNSLFEAKKKMAVPVTKHDVRKIPRYKTVRNNLFRLFSPYL